MDIARVLPWLLAGGLALVAGRSWFALRVERRARFIRSEPFPKGLLLRLQQRRPGLSAADRQLVARGLRQFFLAYLAGGRRPVAMPSQVVDELWHEFILHTRHYERWCRHAFGGLLHHTPAAALAPGRRDNAGLRRVWWHCCREENIDPRRPSRLPLLFALDAKLGIADGFHYTPDCAALRERGDGSAYCAADLGGGGDGGGGDGWDDGGGDASDGGGDGGGGCGGD